MMYVNCNFKIRQYRYHEYMELPIGDVFMNHEFEDI